MRFEKFDGQAELAGRTITIRKAQADFFGGKALGTLSARLLADPSYQFQGRFERVDVARLVRAVPSLSTRVAGTASATLTLTAHGVGRANLVRSMEGDGRLDARNVELSGMDFASLISGNAQDSSPGRFASAQGNFHIGGGGIEVAAFGLETALGMSRHEIPTSIPRHQCGISLRGREPARRGILSVPGNQARKIHSADSTFRASSLPSPSMERTKFARPTP